VVTRRGGRERGLNGQGGDHYTGEDKGSGHVMAGLGVEFDAVTKDRAHGGIEVHEGASDKLAIVEKDAHNHSDGNDPLRQGRRARRGSRLLRRGQPTCGTAWEERARRRGQRSGIGARRRPTVDDEDPTGRDRCRRAATLLGTGRGQPVQGGAAWTAAEARIAALQQEGHGRVRGVGRSTAQARQGRGPPGGCSWRRLGSASAESARRRVGGKEAGSAACSGAARALSEQGRRNSGGASGRRPGAGGRGRGRRPAGWRGWGRGRERGLQGAAQGKSVGGVAAQGAAIGGGGATCSGAARALSEQGHRNSGGWEEGGRERQPAAGRKKNCRLGGSGTM
jgi:hypothetical protein